MTEPNCKTGLLIVIVGPSGAGKDTLLNEIRKDQNIVDTLHFVKRAVTRNAVKDAEDFLALTDEEFADAQRSGSFCVTWQAHGLLYGIPQAALTLVKGGNVVLFNGARRALPDLKKSFNKMLVINITADPDILAMRLMERGREDVAAISARLKQQNLQVDPVFDVINIDNSGRLEKAAEDLKSAIKKNMKAQTLESMNL